MKFYKITLLLLLPILFTNCEQKITIKKHKLTGINPVAYTDVLFKSNHDTVFVSTFDGKIYEVINKNKNRKRIAHIDDEIYNIAYNAEKDEMYAATLHSGIVAINASSGTITRKLPIKETWAYQICYNRQNGILATFDFKGNHYVWDTKNGFNNIETPQELNQMRPKHIADNGDVYFDGQGKIIIWNYKTNAVKQSKANGKIVDVDDEKNLLLVGGKEFAFYNQKNDSTYFKKKHPNWPIHLPGKDSIVNVPLNLEIISGLTTKKSIYTYGLDKSIRKWDKSSGNLTDTYSKHKGTPSGMDISEDESQLVTVDLLGKVQFLDL